MLLLAFPLNATTFADHPENQAPTADFTVEPRPPTAGEPATLDGRSSSDPDGDPLSYAWDLDGDGTVDAKGAVVDHTFPTSGEVTVTLTVSDDHGASDAHSQVVTVNTPPEAGTVEVTAPTDPYVGETWEFATSGSGDDDAGDTLTYAWDLGDGATAAGPAVQHAYDAPGTYTVTVTVTDDAGATDTAQEDVTVVNRAPVADLVVDPTEATAGQEVTFDASASSDPDGQALTYAWDVDGDGQPDATTDAPTYVHVYTTNTQDRAPFEATVTVDDGELTATSAAVQVTVANATPTAAFTLTPDQEIDTTTTVVFDASTTSDVEDTELAYAWDLGDGTTLEGPQVEHRYARMGTYEVTLTVTDSDGGSGTATRSVPVANAPPVVVVTPTQRQAVPGATLTLDASASLDPEGTALTFRWEAEGHATGSGPTFDVSYDAEGRYPVSLTITDEDGAATSVVVEVLFDNDLVWRVSGSNRLDTAVALAVEAFPTAPQAILARADAFPDALAASTLAAEIGGPILLTPRDELFPSVADELRRLGVEHVYLAGGTAALGVGVEQGLDALGLPWTRLEGPDRFGTAAAIADEVVRLGGPVEEVVIALGAHADPNRAWPDALVAGNLATSSRAPVLLVTPTFVPDATLEALKRVHTGKRVWIAGGEGAISRQVQDRLAIEGWDVRRLAGPTRYATAVVLAEEARRRGVGPGPVVLASGHNFPDALAATVMAWRLGGLLLLVDPHELTRSDATYGWLRHHREAVDTVFLAGGTAAVSDPVREQVADRIQDGRSN